MNRFTLLAAVAVTAFVAGCTSETSDNAPVPQTPDQSEQDNPIAVKRQGTLQRPGEPTVHYDRDSVDSQMQAAKVKNIGDVVVDVDRTGLQR